MKFSSYYTSFDALQKRGSAGVCSQRPRLPVSTPLHGPRAPIITQPARVVLDGSGDITTAGEQPLVSDGFHQNGAARSSCKPSPSCYIHPVKSNHQFVGLLMVRQCSRQVRYRQYGLMDRSWNIDRDDTLRHTCSRHETLGHPEMPVYAASSKHSENNYCHCFFVFVKSYVLETWLSAIGVAQPQSSSVRSCLCHHSIIKTACSSEPYTGEKANPLMSYHAHAHIICDDEICSVQKSDDPFLVLLVGTSLTDR